MHHETTMKKYSTSPFMLLFTGWLMLFIGISDTYGVPRANIICGSLLAFFGLLWAIPTGIIRKLGGDQ